MARNNAGLLLVTSGVTGQLQNFSSQILQHGGHIDSSTDTNAVGILSFLQVASSSRNRELQTSTEALGDLLRVLTTTALSAACKNLTCFPSISIPFMHPSARFFTEGSTRNRSQLFLRITQIVLQSCCAGNGAISSFGRHFISIDIYNGNT